MSLEGDIFHGGRNITVRFLNFIFYFLLFLLPSFITSYTYTLDVLSAAMDSGVGISAILIFFLYVRLYYHDPSPTHPTSPHHKQGCSTPRTVPLVLTLYKLGGVSCLPPSHRREQRWALTHTFSLSI